MGCLLFQSYIQTSGMYSVTIWLFLRNLHTKVKYVSYCTMSHSFRYGLLGNAILKNYLPPTLSSQTALIVRHTHHLRTLFSIACCVIASLSFNLKSPFSEISSICIAFSVSAENSFVSLPYIVHTYVPSINNIF